MHFEIAARAIQGGRQYQEDSWRAHTIGGQALGPDLEKFCAVADHGAFVLVADGLGGAAGGARASELVADNFSQSFFASQGSYEQRLANALKTCNDVLATEKLNSRLERGAGTTLAAGVFFERRLTFISVGDCTIWRLRDDEIHKVNASHETLAHIDISALQQGNETAWNTALASPHRGKSRVTSAVTGAAISEKQIATREIKEHDIYILASDGIETLSLEHLRRATLVLGSRGDTSAIANGLAELIERIGGSKQDNATLLIVRTIGVRQDV